MNKQMKSHENAQWRASAVESGNHFKNGVSPKNQRSRRNFLNGITKGLFIFMTVMLLGVTSAWAQTYNENDKEGLRAFLRQPSAEANQINAERLGLQIADTLDWQNSETWVANVLNLTWNNDSPKRLIRISDGYPYGWSYGKKLAGTLDASKWTELTNLNFWLNEVTELIVSANTKLTDLKCNQNLLTELDVSACTALTYLDCNNNLLTELDVNGKAELTYLSCYNNQLTDLNVNGCIALTELLCFHNQLSTLNINSNINLQHLECYNNQLNSLDVTKNTALEFLDCGTNQITDFDFSNNPELKDLRCHTNKLTTLDVSTNMMLTRLECQVNQLIELKIAPNITSLWIMYCEENHLLLSDLFIISEILNNCGTPLNNRRLSKQTWAKRTAGIDTGVVFTPPQNVFGGEYTYFTVTKNDEPAIEGVDYSVIDGKLTFHISGNYIVTMKNDAIISNDENLVFVEIEVTCSPIWEIGYPEPANVVATLDCSGTLTICGTGAMKDWDPYWINNNNSAPWYIDGVKDEIQEVVICEGVTTIGNAAFLDCYNITSIVIPNGITKIGDNAFQSCCNLTDIDIPVSVMYIGTEAFAWTFFCGAGGLKNVYVHWDFPITSVFSNTFAGSLTTVNLYVPPCTQQLYAIAPVWKEFNIVGLSDEWQIGKNYPADNLIATFNNGILTISGEGEMQEWASPEDTPWNCVKDDITTIVIHNGLTTITTWAFWGCCNFDMIIIWGFPPTIYENAFGGCGKSIPNNVLVWVKDMEYCDDYENSPYWSEFSDIQCGPIILGVEDITLSQIKIYPNPTAGQLTIDNGQLTIENIEIFNLMGQRAMSFKSLPSLETTIDVSHLPPGIYFIKIGEKTAKFVKE